MPCRHLLLKYGRGACRKHGPSALQGTSASSRLGRLDQSRVTAYPASLPSWSGVVAPASEGWNALGAPTRSYSSTATASTSQATASEVLAEYASRRGELGLRDATTLLGRLEQLQPSVYDERLQGLAGDIVAQRQDLPLGTLVDVARIVQSFGFDEDMTSLLDLAVDSTSFLPPDVVLSFAKTLAVAAQRSGSLIGTTGSRAKRDTAGLKARAAVFRILGEHVREAMFDTAPDDLAEALLAMAVFYCSRKGGAPDPVLARQQHQEVFSGAAGLLLGGRAAVAPPPALVKCLRAYTLLLLGRRPARRLGPGQAAIGPAGVSEGEAKLLPPSPGAFGDFGGFGTEPRTHQVVPGGADATLVPPALAEELTGKVGQLSAQELVRSLHAFTSLHNSGVVQFDTRSKKFCRASMLELEGRVQELAIKDVTFALQALASVAGSSARPEWQPISMSGDPDAPQRLTGASPVTASLRIRRRLIKQLFGEVQQHVAALTLKDALSLAKSAERLSHLARPGLTVDLLAAEVSREVRSLEAQQVCDAASSFSRLGYKEAGFMQSLSQRFVATLEDFLPRQLSVTLYSLVSGGVRERSLSTAVAPQIIRDFVGFREKDMALCLWSFSKLMHRHAPLFEKIQDGLSRSPPGALTPQDLSMILWSFAHAGWEVDSALLSKLTHIVSRTSSTFPPEALVTTCVAFAKMGFAQQPLLVDVYRSLYGQLPLLTDPQLCFSFFLYSTSGLRDEALVRRFLFEASRRLPGLRGQDLGNLMMACSRSTSPQLLQELDHFDQALKARVFEELDALEKDPMLSVFLAAPKVFTLSEDEALHLMAVASERFPEMDAAELSRCLTTVAAFNVVHKPVLLPLFHFLHKDRARMTADEVIASIRAVHSLGFCKPKFQRSLGFMLLEHAKEWRVPAGSLCSILPALQDFGFWTRLPRSLRLGVWRLAKDEEKMGVEPPPPPENRWQATQDEGGPTIRSPWRLPTLRKGFFRQRGRPVSRHQQIDSLKKDIKEVQEKEIAEEKEVLEANRPSDSKKAIEDFMQMIKKL